MISSKAKAGRLRSTPPYKQEVTGSSPVPPIRETPCAGRFPRSWRGVATPASIRVRSWSGSQGRRYGPKHGNNLFVTSQGSAYVRFRRALDSHNADCGAGDCRRARLRQPPRTPSSLSWSWSTTREVPAGGAALARSLLRRGSGRRVRGGTCRARLPGWPRGPEPKAAAGALAELVHRRGFERAREVLRRWVA
jgi:hypothetical protein